MQKNMHKIILIFPDFEEKIETLYSSNENFRDLCSDYVLCAKSVHEIKEDFNKYKEQIEEYEGLKSNLKEEILSMITKEK